MLDFITRSLKKLESQITDYEVIRQKFKVLKTIPFNSQTKKMTVAVEIEPSKTVRVFTKGATETLLDDCISMIEKNSEIVDLDISKREKIKESILKQMTKSAFRTLALAYKDMPYE